MVFEAMSRDAGNGEEGASLDFGSVKTGTTILFSFGTGDRAGGKGGIQSSSARALDHVCCPAVEGGGVRSMDPDCGNSRATRHGASVSPQTSVVALSDILPP